MVFAFDFAFALELLFKILLQTFTTGLFVRGSKQPYVSTKTVHYPKYFDQFSTVLLATFTTRLIFAR